MHALYRSRVLIRGSGTPQIVDVHMAEFSDTERDKVKGGNLERLLPWPGTAAAKPGTISALHSTNKLKSISRKQPSLFLRTSK